jgi:hypothetical protein
MITSVPAPIKSRVTQAAELLSFEDAIAANLSYSGFYCTRDLEQKTDLSGVYATDELKALTSCADLESIPHCGLEVL